MLCRMPPGVQNETPELASSGGSSHVMLPMPRYPIVCGAHATVLWDCRNRESACDCSME